MPTDARIKRPGFSKRSIFARRGAARCAAPRVLGPAFAAACLLGAADGALAQQTVIIGGGSAPAPLRGAGALGTIGVGGDGIEVNESVLDSLGPGDPAAGVPLAAPRAPVRGAGLAPGVAPGAYLPPEAGAYRLPGTGELVVTRPSTLLYPPQEPPRSRLAVPPVKAATIAKPARPAAAAPAGKLTSRLIAEPPKPRPSETMDKPKVAAKPKMAEEKSAAAPRPAESARVPAMPEAPAPGAAPITAEAPAKPSVPAPPPTPRLTKDMLAESAKQAAAPPAAPTPKAEPPKTGTPSAPSAAPKAPAAPPPKVAAPAAPSAPAEVQEAARTPGVTAAPSGADLRLSFPAGTAELSDAAKAQLRDLAQSLSLNTSRRVQLLAYAADSGEGASRARRLSLSRALAVRAYLIDQGVRSTRMDVRALGSNAGDGPADRVDVLPQ